MITIYKLCLSTTMLFFYPILSFYCQVVNVQIISKQGRLFATPFHLYRNVLEHIVGNSKGGEDSKEKAQSQAKLEFPQGWMGFKPKNHSVWGQGGWGMDIFWDNKLTNRGQQMFYFFFLFCQVFFLSVKKNSALFAQLALSQGLLLCWYYCDKKDHSIICSVFNLFMVIFFKFKGDVHLLHNQQEIEHQFRGSEG